MIKIYFDNELIDSDLYGGLTRNGELFNGSFRAGATLCEQYTFSVYKDEVSTIYPARVYIYNDDELQKTLYVNNVSENDLTLTYELTDGMINFNFPYDASKIMVEGETTLGEIFQDIVSQAQLTTDISTFDYYVMTVSWYDNNITARDYLKFIAELNAGFFYMTPDNKLAFKRFKRDSITTISFNEISKYNIGQQHIITRVVWDDGINKWEAGTDTGDTYYINTQNVYVTSEDMVNNIYENLNGFEYYDFEVNDIPKFAKSKNMADYSTFEDGYVTFDGNTTTIHSLDEMCSQFIKVKPNTKYTFSIQETTSTFDNWFGVGEYRTADKTTFIRRDTVYLATETHITFTTTENTNYIIVSARNLKNATKIQLEEGIQTDYEPYFLGIYAGDIITFSDGTNEYPVIAQYHGLKLSGNEWFGGISSKLDSTKQEETQIIGVAKSIKSIKNIVDRDSNTISTIIEQTNTIQSDLRDNYYTSDQVQQLVQSAEAGLTNTFSLSGGNNIFRNTGLWFSVSDENNPYEFWTGKANWTNENRAVNLRAILLQNGTFSQQQAVPNGVYTISFKMEKDIALTNAKVVINDVEYILTESEFEQAIQVNGQTIKIDFVCDVDNGCRIYDLMVNAGDVKLVYTQNQNETTTDTVNISKGITISSSNYDVTFKANADGIRTIDRNGTELTTFTDKGMVTEEAEIKGKSKIVGLLYQEVGSQTWITKL